MKTMKYMLGALLLLSALTACRQESDNLYNYAHNDVIITTNAQAKFSEKFNTMWHGLDQNYAIFDYEKQYGVNWDDIYNEYLPLFEDLDRRSIVSDEDLKELLTKAVAPLHDGHMFVQMKNHLTGNYVSVSPSIIRNQTRDDYEIAETYNPDISSYYITDLKEYATASTRFEEFWDNFNNDKNIGMKWLYNKIKEIQSKISITSGSQSEHDAYMLKSYGELYSKLTVLVKSAKTMSPEAAINDYNEIANAYSYLNVPGMYIFDASFAERSMFIAYALTNNNIAYIQLSDFALTPALDSKARQQYAQSSVAAQTMLNQVARVWQQWFDAIQYHHKAGDLKGVIIDLRNNNGGLINDFKYLIGALVSTDVIKVGKSRFKRGTGRYDYSVVMPYELRALTQEHVSVSEPIVVLTNCKSVSMAEMTTSSLKQLPNAKQIGKRTWGGLCAINESETYSLNYAGHVGVMNQTPVYCYVPQMVFMNDNEQILEGVGLEPDIEVDFDEKLYVSTGHDSQFDRAVDYIVNGK